MLGDFQETIRLVMIDGIELCDLNIKETTEHINMGHLRSSGLPRAILTISTIWPTIYSKLISRFFLWSFVIFFPSFKFYSLVELIPRHFTPICTFATVVEFPFPLYFLNRFYMEMTEFVYLLCDLTELT